MLSKTVRVDNNSFDSAGITKDPHIAVCEFIWNALEASATTIDIDILGQELVEPPQLVIIDNGTGIPFSTLDETFGMFLSSPKIGQGIRIKTQTNKGRGRFSYQAISSSARWNTVYEENGVRKSYSISMSSDRKFDYIISEPTVLDDKASTGTEVTIPISSASMRAIIQISAIKQRLLEEFAWYLFLHKERNIAIRYQGCLIDYNDYINTQLSRESNIEIDGALFRVSIVVWKNRIDNSSKIYYMNSAGVICSAENTSFNKNAVQFYHGVFVRSSYFDDIPVLLDTEDAALLELKEGQRDVMHELKKQIRLLIDVTLRDHLILRADEFLNDEKTIQNFPRFTSDDVGQAKRKDFCRVTKELFCAEPHIFYNLDNRSAKALYGFMALLLDSDERENILLVIEQIVDLTPEQRAKFTSVLRKTKLAHIIDMVDILQQRYFIIQELRKIVYDMGKFSNERTHVQRIVESNYWLFGDQYSLVSADVRISRTLSEFEKLLDIPDTGRTSLSDEESRQRMDIVLYATRFTESQTEEGLIVELKAPTVTLSLSVLNQIERYAAIIRKEPRLSGQSRQWRFMAVCSTIDDDVISKFAGHDQHGNPGLVDVMGNFEIYALTWDEVFLRFERKYDFIARKIKEDIASIDTNDPDVDTVSRQVVDAKVDSILELSEHMKAIN